MPTAHRKAIARARRRLVGELDHGPEILDPRLVEAAIAASAPPDNVKHPSRREESNQVNVKRPRR